MCCTKIAQNRVHSPRSWAIARAEHDPRQLRVRSAPPGLHPALYRAGYPSGRCISLESKIARTKDACYAALETVRRAVRGGVGRFTKAEILALRLALSKTSVEGSIKRLVDLGELEKHGSGRNTFYARSE